MSDYQKLSGGVPQTVANAATQAAVAGATQFVPVAPVGLVPGTPVNFAFQPAKAGTAWVTPSSQQFMVGLAGAAAGVGQRVPVVSSGQLTLTREQWAAVFVGGDNEVGLAAGGEQVYLSATAAGKLTLGSDFAGGEETPFAQQQVIAVGSFLQFTGTDTHLTMVINIVDLTPNWVTKTVIYGLADAGVLAAGQPVTFGNLGKLVEANASNDAPTLNPVFAIAADVSAPDNGVSDVTGVTSGLLGLPTATWDAVTGQVGGLTLNAPYYLDTTAGKLTTIKPSAPDAIVQVGIGGYTFEYEGTNYSLMVVQISRLS